MSRSRSLHAALAATCLVAACADPPTAPPRVLADDPPAGFELLFPTLDPEALVARYTAEDFGESAPPAGPFRPGPAAVSAEELEDAVAALYDTRTLAGFSSGSAYAFGEHRYQGNKSRIETTANVEFQNDPIGSQVAYREDGNPFIFDFGVEKYISVMAKIFTDHDCGLEVYGRSSHTAWWEAVLGGSVSTYGRVGRTSFSDLKRQDECDAGRSSWYGGGGADSGPSGAICYFSVWYDIFTGYIYSAELLYCSDYGD